MAFIENDVYEYFKKEIEDSANEQIEKLTKSIKETKEKQLESMKEDIRDTIDRATETELSEINTDFSTTINKIKTNTHQGIIKKKHELLDSIIEEVLKKCMKYVTTDQYKKSMEAAIKRVDKDFCGDKFVFQIKKDDKVLEKLIQDHYSKKCEIEPVEKIKIGGFIGICTKKGILTDLTIDNQLEEAKNRFYEKSKLAIKE